MTQQRKKTNNTTHKRVQRIKKTPQAKFCWNKVAWISVIVIFGVIIIGGYALYGLWENDQLPTSPAELEKAKLHWKNRTATIPTWGKETLPDEDCIGIDISHYQGKVNWDKLCFYFGNQRIMQSDSTEDCQRREVDFVIAKATEGTTKVDSQYKRNKEQAREKSVLFGAYHFFSAGVDPQAQAEHFMNTANLKKGDIVPILDVEPVKEKLPSADDVLIWLQAVENYYEVKPVIYTGAHCYNTFFHNDKRFAKYEFWIARYNEERPEKYHLLWQTSDMGLVHGINGRVDIDIFHGTKRELEIAYTIP